MKVKFAIRREGVVIIPAGSLVQLVGFIPATLLKPRLAIIRHGQSEVQITADSLGLE